MKQVDKSDKSHLTFGSSTSDEEKIIKVVDHGMKTAASHHANNSVRDRWGAKETERESVIHVIVVAGRISCVPNIQRKPCNSLFLGRRGGGGHRDPTLS